MLAWFERMLWTELFLSRAPRVPSCPSHLLVQPFVTPPHRH